LKKLCRYRLIKQQDVKQLSNLTSSKMTSQQSDRQTKKSIWMEFIRENIRILPTPMSIRKFEIVKCFDKHKTSTK
jgi:hypothetical protein